MRAEKASIKKQKSFSARILLKVKDIKVEEYLKIKKILLNIAYYLNINIKNKI